MTFVSGTNEASCQPHSIRTLRPGNQDPSEAKLRRAEPLGDGVAGRHLPSLQLPRHRRQGVQPAAATVRRLGHLLPQDRSATCGVPDHLLWERRSTLIRRRPSQAHAASPGGNHNQRSNYHKGGII